MSRAGWLTKPSGMPAAVQFALVDAAFYVDNLLNEHPLLNWDRELIDITSGAYTIQPRTIGAEFTYRFE